MPVDFRSLCFHPALQQQVRFIGSAFEKNFDSPSDHTTQLTRRNLRLLFHQLIAPPSRRPAGNFRIEVERGRAFFVGINEDADVIELNVVREAENFVEIGLRLTWKSNNKRRPKTRIGQQSSNSFNLTLVDL